MSNVNEETEFLELLSQIRNRITGRMKQKMFKIEKRIEDLDERISYIIKQSEKHKKDDKLGDFSKIVLKPITKPLSINNDPINNSMPIFLKEKLSEKQDVSKLSINDGREDLKTQNCLKESESSDGIVFGGIDEDITF